MTEQNMLLNTTPAHQKGLCRKTVRILHGKWEAPPPSGRGTSGSGYGNSWPHSAIWWNVYYTERSQLFNKKQHMTILKIKLSIESSRDSLWFLKMYLCMTLLYYGLATEGTLPFTPPFHKDGSILQSDRQKGFRSLVQILALSLTGSVTLEKSACTFNVHLDRIYFTGLLWDFSTNICKDHRDMQGPVTLHRH